MNDPLVSRYLFDVLGNNTEGCARGLYLVGMKRIRPFSGSVQRCSKNYRRLFSLHKYSFKVSTNCQIAVTFSSNATVCGVMGFTIAYLRLGFEFRSQRLLILYVHRFVFFSPSSLPPPSPPSSLPSFLFLSFTKQAIALFFKTL